MADPRPNYTPLDADLLHKRAMQNGSTMLLQCLRAEHPRILQRLLAKRDLTNPYTRQEQDQ